MTPTGYNRTSPESPIAICGGGFDYKVKLELEGAYQQTGGKVSTEFIESARAALVGALSPGDLKVLTDCFERIACENRVESRCTLQRNSCQRQYDSPYASCIERPRLSCIKECVRRYGHSLDRCSEYFCNIDETTDPGRVNRARWDRMCSDERDAIGACEESYRACLDRGRCVRPGEQSRRQQVPLSELRVDEVIQSLETANPPALVQLAQATVDESAPPPPLLPPRSGNEASRKAASMAPVSLGEVSSKRTFGEALPKLEPALAAAGWRPAGGGATFERDKIGIYTWTDCVEQLHYDAPGSALRKIVWMCRGVKPTRDGNGNISKFPCCGCAMDMLWRMIHKDYGLKAGELPEPILHSWEAPAWRRPAAGPFAPGIQWANQMSWQFHLQFANHDVKVEGREDKKSFATARDSGLRDEVSCELLVEFVAGGTKAAAG